MPDSVQKYGFLSRRPMWWRVLGLLPIALFNQLVGIAMCKWGIV